MKLIEIAVDLGINTSLGAQVMLLFALVGITWIALIALAWSYYKLGTYALQHDHEKEGVVKE